VRRRAPFSALSVVALARTSLPSLLDIRSKPSSVQCVRYASIPSFARLTIPSPTGLRSGVSVPAKVAAAPALEHIRKLPSQVEGLEDACVTTAQAINRRMSICSITYAQNTSRSPPFSDLVVERPKRMSLGSQYLHCRRRWSGITSSGSRLLTDQTIRHCSSQGDNLPCQAPIKNDGGAGLAMTREIRRNVIERVWTPQLYAASLVHCFSVRHLEVIGT